MHLETLKQRAKQMEEARNAKKEQNDKERKIELPDGTVLVGEQAIQEYRQSMESKTKLYESKKKDISEMESEDIVLKQTIEILKSRHHDMKEFMKKQEQDAGVEGYYEAQIEMERNEELIKEADEEKEQILQENNDMVEKINVLASESKERLEPMVSA